jgi:hypothetical protein
MYIQDFLRLPEFSAWISRKPRNSAMILFQPAKTRMSTVIALSKLRMLSCSSLLHGTWVDNIDISYIAIGRKPAEQ